jgi:hypothetical protein
MYTLVHIVTCIPIATQRQGKQFTDTHAQATVGHPFLAKGPLTMPP